MGIFRRRRLRRDVTAVVFSCPDADLAKFRVAEGPCVPLAEGEPPFLSPLLQDGGETPELTAALYAALTGLRPTQALDVVDRVGEGRLSRLSEDFVQVMAASCEESLRLADADEASGDQELSSFSHHQRALSRAWMEAGRWPREVVGLENRLVRLGHARQALRAGDSLYVWHGPPVPQFVITTGRGPHPMRG